MKHCLRSNGTERAWFTSKAAAEAFAEITPGYDGDIAHFCDKCGWWHLSRIEWLVPSRYGFEIPPRPFDWHQTKRLEKSCMVAGVRMYGACPEARQSRSAMNNR